jgi:Asp-tRNA(Asn)/Glu-tRNA(Gln) amidotransferase A subunit family amidase
MNRAIEAWEPHVNAFTELLETEPGAFDVAVKDVIWMKGLRATRGSRAFADYVCPEDAVAVRRLRAAGAAIIGRTTNPELCFRGVTQSELHGVTRNPFDRSRVAGGSSGGSGAAVAYGAVRLALGTDGGGSIRIPASFCGVVGHKPTFGLVPVTPGFRGWETLSVLGPITQTVADARFLLDIIAGPDPGDPASLGVPRLPLPTSRAPAPGHASPNDPAAAASPAASAAASAPATPAVANPAAAALEPPAAAARSVLRVAASVDLGQLPVEPAVRDAFTAAVDELRAAGWAVEDAHPEPIRAAPIWDGIGIPEGYAADRALLERPELLEPDTARLIAAGRDVSAAQYLDALEERARYIRAWAGFFTRFDVILTPTMQMTAFPIGGLTPEAIDGVPVDPFFDDWCNFCLPANLTGFPATSVPCGYDEDGMPIGLQVMGPRGADDWTLAVAEAWEALFADRRRSPRLPD